MTFIGRPKGRNVIAAFPRTSIIIPEDETMTTAILILTTTETNKHDQETKNNVRRKTKAKLQDNTSHDQRSLHASKTETKKFEEDD